MSSSRLRAALAAALTAASALCAPLAHAATTISSGDSIYITKSDKTTSRCTLNHVVTEPSGQNRGVTAGHCLRTKDGVRILSVKDASGHVISSNPIDVVAVRTGNASFQNPRGDLTDIGTFRLASGVRYSGELGGGTVSLPIPMTALSSELASVAAGNINPPLRVAGTLPVSAIRPGEVVCKDGSSTARTCGLVLATNPSTGTIFAAIPAMSGDSGSPLYVNRADGTWIVGTLSQGSPLLFNLFDGAQV